ncbi:hypothetical protein [Mangrovicoccus sp. HB161399]|uniref:hypothetical protein n=1 Tax=Mangrovicoccus sp. HB161399 TaxID=2720392 RepID=UPI001555F622|nr:hypothetical protein [Mangrovicoccus sp. HB161399]
MASSDLGTYRDGGWSRRHGAFLPRPQAWLVRSRDGGDGTGFALLDSEPGAWLRPSRSGYAVRLSDMPPEPLAMPLPPLGKTSFGRAGWSCWKAVPRDVPLLLSVAAGRAGRGPVRRLQVPLAAEGGARAWLDAGRISGPFPAAGGPAHWTLGWQLPPGIGGEMAGALILLGLQGVMEALSRPLCERPFLLQLDLAGLGLDRNAIRRLECALSEEMKRFSMITGRGALLVGELGFVQEYADASVILQPGRAVRMDLLLPKKRSAPVFLDLQQSAGSGACGPLALSLQAQSGERLDIVTGRQQEEGCSEIRTGNGGLAAKVCADPRSGTAAARLSHVIGFAPTFALSAFGRNRAEPGEWNLILRNIGRETARLTFDLDNAMPLLPDWQMPRASLQMSRSQEWDAEMLDYVRPEFFGYRGRFEALVKRADAVPPLVMRRYVEVGSWPVASVSAGTEIHPMPVLGARTRAGFPAMSLPVPVREAMAQELSPAPQEDRLLGLCIELLANVPPRGLAQRLAEAVASARG